MVQSKKKSISLRPPIIAVLGHVDHGKTTLLDTIRKSDIAHHEHGGITQHIGAYQVEVKSHPSAGGAKGKGEEEKRLITFIDTPGHEAFAKMRTRGAAVADVAILVVAGDDSVKPQTEESIVQIKEAGIPMIVAINKSDLPTSDISRVKSDLAKVGVQVEGFGGDIPVVSISAKTGDHITELLDTILLIAEMKQLISEPKSPLEAVVIEAHVDKGKGIVASVVVKKGTLIPGLQLFEGETLVGKVRAILDGNEIHLDNAIPSAPVEILGFSVLPHIGAMLTEHEGNPTPIGAISSSPIPSEMPDFLKPLEEAKQRELTIILKANSSGSLEAVTASLPKQVHVVSAGIGDVTEADVTLAKATKSIIIGFNITCRSSVMKLAQTEKVIYRIYTIIYELISELTDVVSGLKEVLEKERELGNGTIIAEFPFEKTRIAGTRVASGRIARGDSVKIMRGDTLIAKAKIKSMRQGKNEVTKIEAGGECGVLFDREVDFMLQDGIIPVTIG